MSIASMLNEARRIKAEMVGQATDDEFIVVMPANGRDPEISGEVGDFIVIRRSGSLIIKPDERALYPAWFPEGAAV